VTASRALGTAPAGVNLKKIGAAQIYDDTRYGPVGVVMVLVTYFISIGVAPHRDPPARCPFGGMAATAPDQQRLCGGGSQHAAQIAGLAHLGETAGRGCLLRHGRRKMGVIQERPRRSAMS
jgi:hypothetical protein